MNRRRLLQSFALAFLAAALVVRGQTSGKVYRIGWIGTMPPATPEARRLPETFEQKLRELGYVEGKNLVIERRYAEGRYERLPALAAELVGLKVDVILANTTPSARAAKHATRDIPIVMAAVSDPVGAGLVASLARPGGNVTGLSLLNVELTAKRLELLKQIVPGLARVAVLWNPGNRSNELQIGKLRSAAKALDVRLRPLVVRTSEEVEGALQSATPERAGALVVLDDGFLFQQQRRIAGFAAQNGLATMSGLPGFAQSGGLMSYGLDFEEHYRQAAIYVGKILKGAKPGDLPVEQPAKLEFVINLKTAKALGLTIPPSLLLRADRLIE